MDIKRTRKTDETTIEVTASALQSDGDTPKVAIDTGIPFFDHMLNTFGLYARINLAIEAKGDLSVDYHHTVEDVGLVLGEALLKLYQQGNRRARFGHAVIPMDDSLAEVVIDVCNRPYLVYKPVLPQQWVGSFPVALVREFFYALTTRALWTLHLRVHYAENSHHAIEALFKAWGRAYDTASAPLFGGAFSTKGTLRV